MLFLYLFFVLSNFVPQNYEFYLIYANEIANLGDFV